MSSNGKAGIRWWPAVLIGALAVFGWLTLNLTGDRSGQEKVLWSLVIAILSLFLLLIWVLVGSRLPWRVRLKVLLVVVVFGFACGLMFEIEGVTGNLLPILGWRWERSAPIGVPGSDESSLEGTGVSLDVETLSYPRFLGPRGNATIDSPTLEDEWGEELPREIWRRPVGAAWSAFAVAKGLAITQEQHGSDEEIVAYELMSGEVVWRRSDPARYETTLGGVGPRATPTIDGNRVYTLGATGILNALDLDTGEGLWSANILDDAGSANEEWGKAGSPLVFDGLVIVSAGGKDGKSMLAYDSSFGNLVWSGGDDRSGYSSPNLATLSGREQILILNRASVAAHSPATGEVLWQYPWSKGNPNVAQPLPISHDTVLVSSGYGVGSKLLRIVAAEDGGLIPELVWESPRLKAKFANFILFEGNVFGLDDGVLVCLDPETGERRWKKGRYGHGQIMLVADKLIVLSEKGRLILVRPDPTGLVELADLQVLEGKTWNNPALAGPYLLVRNHLEAAMYELPVTSR